MTVKEGWTGRVYEDFEVGDVYPHPLGRTVIAADNIWFTLLTQNTNPIHFDHAYAAKTEFKRPLVDSTFTLALVTGQSVSDISQNAMANLGWDEVRLPNPVFEGDTIYSRSEVLDKRESASRPNVGIVRFKTTGFNEHGTVVIEFKRTIMVYKREHAPATLRTVRRHRSDRVGPTGHQDARPRVGGGLTGLCLAVRLRPPRLLLTGSAVCPKGIDIEDSWSEVRPRHLAPAWGAARTAGVGRGRRHPHLGTAAACHRRSPRMAAARDLRGDGRWHHCQAATDGRSVRRRDGDRGGNSHVDHRRSAERIQQRHRLAGGHRLLYRCRLHQDRSWAQGSPTNWSRASAAAPWASATAWWPRISSWRPRFPATPHAPVASSSRFCSRWLRPRPPRIQSAAARRTPF